MGVLVNSCHRQYRTSKVVRSSSHSLDEKEAGTLRYELEICQNIFSSQQNNDEKPWNLNILEIFYSILALLKQNSAIVSQLFSHMPKEDLSSFISVLQGLNIDTFDHGHLNKF